MYLILVIGMTGQGKTVWLKKFIDKKKQYVFDVNNEYKNLPEDSKYSPQMRNIDLSVKKFLEVAKTLKNTNVVFEDATGFLRGRQSAELSQLIVQKRHSGNTYIMLFHSINRVPPELMEMCNYLILFKTNDNLKQIENKFNNQILNRTFLQLQRQKQFSFYQIQMIAQ